MVLVGLVEILCERSTSHPNSMDSLWSQSTTWLTRIPTLIYSSMTLSMESSRPMLKLPPTVSPSMAIWSGLFPSEIPRRCLGVILVLILSWSAPVSLPVKTRRRRILKAVHQKSCFRRQAKVSMRPSSTVSIITC